MNAASEAPVTPAAGAGRRALAQLNAAAALFLLVAGAMVTSTDSGLAVPDWPLSYGKWLPTMTGGVFFEHGHRMVAAAVGFTILVMAFWTQWEETRPAVKKLAWVTLFAVSLQGVLGGITVFYGLPTAVSASHAVLGQTVFCLLIAMAELVAHPEGVPAARPAGGLARLGLAAVAALWLQLVLGAILRHGGSGLVWHLLGAFAAAGVAGGFAAAVLRERLEPELCGPASALLILLAFQFSLGLAIADFRLQPSPKANYAMIAAATAHLAVGAFLLGASVLLALRLRRLRVP